MSFSPRRPALVPLKLACRLLILALRLLILALRLLILALRLLILALRLLINYLVTDFSVTPDRSSRYYYVARLSLSGLATVR
jgi:hypothetical protein